MTRPVFVIGPPRAQWMAQQLLFSKIQENTAALTNGVPGQISFDVEVIFQADSVDYLVGQGGTKLRDIAELSVTHILGVSHLFGLVIALSLSTFVIKQWCSLRIPAQRRPHGQTWKEIVFDIWVLHLRANRPADDPRSAVALREKEVKCCVWNNMSSVC